MKIFISFDFDRTLADYSKAHGNSLLEGIHLTFNRKFQVNFHEISNSGLTDLQIITLLVHNHGISYEDIFKQMNLCVHNIVKKFDDYSYFHPVELLVGAEETLKNLSYRDNVIIGLSTGNIKEICLNKARLTGIDEYFAFGSFGDEAFNRDQLLQLTKYRLQKEFGYSKKDIALHVGDSVMDILSAKKAGFIPIGVSTGSYTKEKLLKAGAKFVFERISDLDLYFDEIIDSIQNKNYATSVILK